MGPSSPSSANYFPPEASESPLPGGEVTPSASPHYLILIAICSSILAAVVVGVVAYLVFKRSVGRAQGDAAALRRRTLAQLGLHSNNNVIRDREELRCSGGAARCGLRLKRGNEYGSSGKEVLAQPFQGKLPLLHQVFA